MAIQFSQQAPQGVTVNYNVVNQLNYDPLANQTNVGLVSYVDQAAFTAGAQPFPGQGFTLPGQLSVTDAENAIIARPEWSGATIVS